jgi:hypothetical protein
LSAAADIQASPEWEAARQEWRAQADGELSRMQAAVLAAAPDQLAREVVYAPVHDIAGLAPVFDYMLLGKIARGLMEQLRQGPNPLDARMLAVCKAYLAAMSALHAKDVRGEAGPAGEAVLARLASIQP